MSTTRPKLRLDEQSFQDLLAAAFTIQEHNAKRKSVVAAQKVCAQCGAAMPAGKEFCTQCGSDPQGLRSGERLQRNWASMWMKSQGQEFQVPTELLIAESANEEQQEEKYAIPKAEAVPSIDAIKNAKAPAQVDKNPSGTLRISEVLEQLESPTQFEVERSAPKDEIEESTGDEQVAHEHTAIQPHYAESFGEADLVALEGELAAESHDPAPAPFGWSNLAFWKKPLRLRFDRADFYLGLSILIAAFVLIWAATSSTASGHSSAQRRPRLTFWEQALVDIGLAEAPEAPAYRGDPKAQVWVDPHTALYYCAGEEQYGKTPDGHYMTQRDAQMDQFEASERSACE